MTEKCTCDPGNALHSPKCPVIAHEHHATGNGAGPYGEPWTPEGWAFANMTERDARRACECVNALYGFSDLDALMAKVREWQQREARERMGLPTLRVLPKEDPRG